LLTTDGSYIAALGAHGRLPHAGQRLLLHRLPRAVQVRHSDTVVSAHRPARAYLLLRVARLFRFAFRPAPARCLSRWRDGSDSACASCVAVMLRRAMTWTTQTGLPAIADAPPRREIRDRPKRHGAATPGPVRDGHAFRYDDVTTAHGSPAFDVTFRCRATHAITDA